MRRPVAFYAPLKPPDHPVPSGDRRMARALIEALTLADLPVELASRLRSYDRDGDALRQRRIEALGGRIAARLARRYARRPPEERPRAWLTYHAYHKSPDWLGPAVTAALAMPYLLAEASFAPKQEGGAWALGHAATERAIRTADVVLALTPIDAECLAPLVAAPAELRRLPPFVDPAPGRTARQERERHRAALARRFALDPQQPWLLTVAMMRADVKRDSYGLLGACPRAAAGSALAAAGGRRRPGAIRGGGDAPRTRRRPGPARRPDPGGSVAAGVRRGRPVRLAGAARGLWSGHARSAGRRAAGGGRAGAVGWPRWSPMAEVAC